MNDHQQNAVKVKHQIFQIIRTPIGDSNKWFEVLRNIHKSFNERKKAEEWILEEGERALNYTILEVFTKR
ncbi:MAG: hypothetical protein ABIO55_08500 [Ginsengibacter sp.]